VKSRLLEAVHESAGDLHAALLEDVDDRLIRERMLRVFFGDELFELPSTCKRHRNRGREARKARGEITQTCGEDCRQNEG